MSVPILIRVKLWGRNVLFALRNKLKATTTTDVNGELMADPRRTIQPDLDLAFNRPGSMRNVECKALMESENSEFEDDCVLMNLLSICHKFLGVASFDSMVILSETFDPYDVFLSFRGPDTRDGFTKSLYQKLIGAGILTYMDDEEMERGKSLEQQLENAIKQSSISIIVFSLNYASSKWCLNELVRILEQKNIHKVIPIFYQVDASDVRYQKGTFEKAFDEHKKKSHVSLEEIKVWKEALTEAANLFGFSSNKKYDDEFIDKILNEVTKSLPKLKMLDVPKLLLGMDYRACDQIHSWFKTDKNVLLLCGIGGIGKSTIAKHIFNEYLQDFDRCSFLVWNEPKWDENEARGLQSQLLSNILYKQRMETTIDEGVKKIERALFNKKVLLVLDNVSETKQLDAFFGHGQEFGPGSKILVTTRNELLANHFIVHPKVHNIECLDEKDSLKLLSWHAFRQDHPPEQFMQLSVDILSRCEGLPLALILLGSSLYEENTDFWEKQLQKWDEIVDSAIHKAMKISYESLEDDKVKNLFLHVACFFVGEEKDYVERILHGCGLHATVGIRILIKRCLVTIDGQKLMMHRVIQDIGREIVRLESTDEPGKRSRLWYHEDSFTVLKYDKGTEAVKGLALDGQKINEVESDGSSCAAIDVNSGLVTNFLGYMKEGFFDRFVHSKEGDLKLDAFAKMGNLELVSLNYVHLTGSCNKFPEKLRWISWHGFSQEYVPLEFPLLNLIAFDLRHSLLKQVWNGYKEVKLLKILNLSYSKHLYQTPDFTGLKQLERLLLRGCSKLVIVSKTIGILQKLVFLDLRDCSSLRDLPALPKTIVTFKISGCNLGLFPREKQNVEPFDWKRLVKFASPSLAWGPVKLLADLPHLIVCLYLEDCNLSDECFPRDFGGLSSLERMDLSGNLITRLPDCVKNLSNSRLSRLNISYCPQLQSVINPPNTLTDMILFNNRHLVKIKFRDNSSKLKLLIDEGMECIETEGCYKVVQAHNVDRKVINNLCLESLSTDFIDAKVKYEFGIFSTCVEGRKIPTCFTTFPVTYISQGLIFPDYYGEEDEEEEEEEEEDRNVPFRISILYTIPSSVAKKIQGLNICVATSVTISFSAVTVELRFDVTVYNKTKDLAWTYKYQDISYTEKEIYTEMLWVSTWKCVDDLFEGGDILEVSFHIHSSGNSFNEFEVMECGIRTVYEEDLEDNQTTDDYGLLWTDQMNVSFSNFRTPVNTYFLLGLCTSSSGRDELTIEETDGRAVQSVDWWGLKQDLPSTKGPHILLRTGLLQQDRNYISEYEPNC